MLEYIRLLIRGARTIGWGPTVQGAIHALRTPWVEAKFAGDDRSLRATLHRLREPAGPALHR